MQKPYREREFGPEPMSKSGGYWIIFTKEKYHLQDWIIIKKLTSQGRLGYRSSICPDPMKFGDHKGQYAICVHTDPTVRKRVKKVLKDQGFGHKIQRYKINTGQTPNPNRALVKRRLKKKAFMRRLMRVREIVAMLTKTVRKLGVRKMQLSLRP